jgi:hypothetical protein
MHLFEFFYPPVPAKESRTGFEGMGGAGYTAYIVERIGFSAHPPLIQFLENLFRYTEYHHGIKTGALLKGSSRPPHIDEVWKTIAGAAWGFAENIPAIRPSPAPPEKTKGIFRSDTVLNRLREESNAVRDMLLTNASNDVTTSEPLVIARKSEMSHTRQAKQSADAFFKELDTVEKETIRLIIAGKTGELANFARKNGTMPELLIDTINGKFLEISGDLLIDSMDEIPIIQGEYIESYERYTKTD